MKISIFTKPICKFLIHRYMGQYLKTELSTDQLEFRLADGAASIQRVMLNTEYINEILDSFGIVSLVEGYVEEISACVPWKNLMSESTIIKVSGLQLTLTPLVDINMANTQELVSSMIGSIASTMDLARSVISDEKFANEVASGGVEQFAGLIDQLISKIKVIFENVVIRIETYSHLCTGLEIQIGRMEFVDEQLENCFNDEETITTQPNINPSIYDLNKLLYIEDVRIYTDIWSPLKERLLCSRTNSHSTDENDDANFQSCYSHFNRSIIFENNLVDSMSPNPILVAQFFSDRHTVRIRVSNTTISDNEAFNKRVDIDFSLCGTLFFYLTPSQLFLIKDLLSRLVPKKKVNINNDCSFGGKPMQPEHFKKITDQFHGESLNEKILLQTWGGQEEFFDLSQNNEESENITKNFFENHSTYFDEDCPLQKESHKIYASTTTLVEKKPNIFAITVQTPALVGILTHDDPLNVENIKKKKMSDFAAMRLAIDDLVEESKQFFKAAQKQKIDFKNLEKQRDILADLCKKDHLRLVASAASFFFSITNQFDQSSTLFEGTMENFDLSECLMPSSIADCTLDKPVHFDLFNLSDKNSQSKDVFTFKIANMLKKPNEFTVKINLENCKTEVDLSILDRISNIIVPQPSFAPFIKLKYAETNSNDNINASLQDNFLFDAIDTQMPTKYTVKFNVSKWTLNIRIPIADLTENVNEYWKRRVYPEYLKLVINNAYLEIPKFSPLDMLNFGLLSMHCTSLTSWFIGECDVLKCTKDEMCFLYANSTSIHDLDCRNSQGVKITIDYDFRNKSLKTVGLSSLDGSSMSNSTRMFAADFAQRAADYTEGPFSKKMEYSGNSPKLVAGSQEELREFSEQCRERTNINIEFSTTRANLFLPSSQFLEIFYNRFGNDLSLWQVKAPVFKLVNFPLQQQQSQPLQFMECKSYNVNSNYEQDSDTTIDDLIDGFYLKDSSESTQNSPTETGSHLFSLTLNSTYTNVLFQTIVNPESENANTSEKNHEIESFKSQLGSQLNGATLFYVYGYNENPNLSYFYVTSSKLYLFHRNLIKDDPGFCKDVLNVKNFAEIKSNDLHAEPISEDEPCSYLNENHLTVALKLLYNSKKNLKDMIIAFNLRNTIIYYKPFSHPRFFWAKQFSKFFNVVDYEVPGYNPPQVRTDLHIDFKSILIGYDHSIIVPNSPLKLRLEISHCHLRSNLVANLDVFSFDCEWQETNMWMRFNQMQYFHKNSLQKKQLKKFVKVMHVGCFQFEINYLVNVNENKKGVPLMEFVCNNDFIKLWLCSDTIYEFLNMVIQFINSDAGKFLLTPKPAEKEVEEHLADLISNMSTSCYMREQQNRIEQMMASALKERPFTEIPRNVSKKKSSHHNANRSKNITLKKHSSSSINTDDEFILVEKVPIKTNNLNAKETSLENNSLDSDYEIIMAQEKRDLAQEFLKENLKNTVLKYSIKNISFHIFLYGGNDFGDSMGPAKTYSKWNSKETNLEECIKTESVGGIFRDETVCVEAKILNMVFVSEIFDGLSEIVASNKLRIGSIEILDHLLVSEIHKIFYPHRLSDEPLCNAPILSISLNEDYSKESILKISVMPIRLNFDQDTLEFLQDFFSNVKQNVRVPNIVALNQKNSNHSLVFEVPNYTVEPEIDTELFENKSVNNLKENVEFGYDENVFLSNSSNKPSPSPSNNIAYMFSEDDVQLNDYNLLSNDLFENSNTPSGSQLNEKKIKEKFVKKSNSSVSLSSSTSSKSRKYSRSNSILTLGKTPTATLPNSTFFKEFIFYPPCKICLDYVGKRVKTDQGALIGFLIGMMNLHRTEITLKSLHNEKGMLGFNKCVQYALDEWVKDIRTRQMASVFGSYAPISALVELTQGIRDLFALPLNELRKDDGHLVNGIQQGASSFSLNTATAAIDATQRMATIIQTMAEFAFDMVTPDYKFQRYRRNMGLTQRKRVAGDMREGLTMAYDAMRDGVFDAAQTLSAAAIEDRASGGGIWGLRGILRHATPTAIRPILIASQATVHVLNGIKNQLKPDEHREELKKWRRSVAAPTENVVVNTNLNNAFYFPHSAER